VGYKIAWEPEALEVLDRLEPLSASQLLDQIDRLAEDPARLSHRSSITYVVKHQYFECDIEGYFVVVFFQYGQDEQTIYITDLGIVRR
jgi:hypothetical protein